MSQLIVNNLSLGYDGIVVSEGINFQVNKGDYLCIVGENGSGKSTLMKTLLDLQKPLSGEVILSGGSSRAQIGYLPQQTPVQKDFPASVQEIVLSGFLASLGSKPFYSRVQKQTALDNMKKLGIYDKRNHCYRNLSGGQQQRVLLARALCATSQMLFLDEPISGLDPAASAEMYEIIAKLNREEDITIVMVSHDIEAAVKRDLCLFNDGNIFDVQGRKHRFPSCSVRAAASVDDLLPDLRAEAGCRLRVLQNDKAGVVAVERAEHLRDVQLVDRGGRAVGKTRHGLDDDHVLGVIHAGDALPEDEIQLGRERMLHGLRRGGIAVDTVRSELLDDAQLLDIAGDRRLRSPEARVVQLREQLLLRLHAVVVDELQNFFLAF